MSETLRPLMYKVEFADRLTTTLCVNGLSVDEMTTVLNEGCAGLEKVMKKHGQWQLYNEWKNGFGIYGIRHVGEHLFVIVGNNYD